MNDTRRNVCTTKLQHSLFGFSNSRIGLTFPLTGKIYSIKNRIQRIDSLNKNRFNFFNCGHSSESQQQKYDTKRKILIREITNLQICEKAHTFMTEFEAWRSKFSNFTSFQAFPVIDFFPPIFYQKNRDVLID